MDQLFDMSPQEYALIHKADKLAARIRKRTEELAIVPDHDESGHYYKYQGQKYPSVTGRLQMLKDPSLMNWKMNRAMDVLARHLERYYDTPFDGYKVPRAALEQIVLQAKEAPQIDFSRAGSIGTAVHNWREEYFGARMMHGYWQEPVFNTTEPQVISGCRAVVKFVKEHNYIPVACELSVADHELQTGGMVDDIGYVDGELSLVDLKTSNIGDKESYFAQVALYLYMFRKLYRVRPTKLYILHASKADGSYKLIDIPNIPETIKWAKQVVEVAKGMDRIKESKKKEYIAI